MPDITVYKATYSGTPVYEFIAKGIACMRRRSDSWINATQILKVADFDKPQRTRILEREVQRGIHEKVQGGYGKYQGTWVPLDRAKQIAAQYKVDELLAPIFDFRPSTESPPLAPKHITAASTKPRPARAPVARPPGLIKQTSKASSTKAPKPAKKTKLNPFIPGPPPPPVVRQPSVESYDDEDDQDEMSDMEPLHQRDMGPEGSTSASAGESDGEMDDHPSQNSASRTLKRNHSQMEHDGIAFMSSPQHGHLAAYSDELLDYFMYRDRDIPAFLSNPPPDFNVNEIIDQEGHTAIHWAASMGDLKVVDLLCRAHADIRAVNKRGETPLMRAVLFTNNYDRRSFPRLVEIFRDTIFILDNFDSSVFHHIAATSSSRNKLLAARYYIEVLLQKLSEARTLDEISAFLDAKDMNGDTALTISARNMAKKCVRTLLGYHANPDIRNNHGETADQFIIAAEHQRRNGETPSGYYNQESSSPIHHPNDYHQYARNPLMQSAATAAAVNYAHASYIPQPHTSEAGIAATKKVIPQMAEMLEGLATAFDKELHEKEEDHLQAQDILSNSTRELEACRSTSEETLAPFGDVSSMNSRIESLKSEADTLSNDLRRILERKQLYELSALVRDEMLEDASAAEDEAMLNPDAELKEKLILARELASVRDQGLELTETIVKAYARSGAGGKMGDYRRLVALSCSLLPDDVEKLLPEILRDLESAQAGGAGIPDGMGMVDGRL